MVLRVSHDPATTWTLRILKRTVCAGNQVKPGDVVENVGYSDQAKLVGCGKAEIVSADAAPADTEPEAPTRKARAKRKAPSNRMVDGEGLSDRGE